MALHQVYLAVVIMTGILIAFVSSYVWKRRHYKGMMFYFWVNIMGILMIISFYVVATTESQLTAYTWMRIRSIAIAMSSMIALSFVLRFIRRPIWMPVRLEVVLWIFPIICLSFFYIPGFEQYFFKQWYIVRLDGYSAEFREAGIAYQILIVHQFSMTTIMLYLLWDYGVRVDSGWRRTVRFLVPTLALLTLIGNSPITLGPPPGLRLTPFMLAITTIISGGLFLRDNTLSILPVAYDLILNSVQDGVIVVKPNGVISRVNPMAERLIGIKALHRPMSEVLIFPANVLLSGDLSCTFEFIHNGLDLEVESLPLYHQKNIVGRTLILRDLSARKQAEREALALAVERERSRLLQQFIGQASNEFSTPMTLMKQALAGLSLADAQERAAQSALIEAQIDEMTRKMQNLRKQLDSQTTANKPMLVGDGTALLKNGMPSA